MVRRSRPRSSFPAQQRAFDRFRQEYNDVRPHEALGQCTPSSLYRPSLRPYPGYLPELEYPSHFDVVRAYPNGVVSFRTVQWYLSACLDSELIGLEQVDDDRWKVHFGPVLLGIMDLRRANERGSRQFATLVRSDGEITDIRRRRLYRR